MDRTTGCEIREINVGLHALRRGSDVACEAVFGRSSITEGFEIV